MFKETSCSFLLAENVREDLIGFCMQRMFKEEKPVWWPLDTWDSKALDRGKARCEATLHAMRNHFNVAASNA